MSRIEGPSGITPQQPQEENYVTQENDTLRGIASKFNVDPEALKNTNNLPHALDDTLKAGQQLLIPFKQLQEIKDPGGPRESIADIAERVPDATTNPFGDILDHVGMNWGDSVPGPDPYDNPTWWEVEPPWMQAASRADEVINPDPTKIGGKGGIEGQ